MPPPPESSAGSAGGNSNSGNPEKAGSARKPAVKHVKIPSRIGALRPAAPPLSNNSTPTPTHTPKLSDVHRRAGAPPLLPPRTSMAPVSMPPRPVPAPPPVTLPCEKPSADTLDAPGSSTFQKSPVLQGGLQVGPSKCADCGRPLTRDSVQLGRAEIVNGKLVCSYCVKKSVNVRDERSLPIRIGAGAAVVLLIVGVFFPSLLLLVLAIVSAASIFGGLLAFTLSGRLRVGLSLGGAVMLGVTVYGISYVSAQKEARRLNALLSDDAEKIHQLLRDGHGVEANQRLTEFRNLAGAKNGDFATPEAASLAQSLGKEVEEWFEHTYRATNPADKDLLQRLIISFGESTAAGSLRFTKVSAGEERVALTAVLPAEVARAAEGPHRNAAMEEAGRLALFVSNMLPRRQGSGSHASGGHASARGSRENRVHAGAALSPEVGRFA